MTPRDRAKQIIARHLPWLGADDHQVTTAIEEAIESAIGEDRQISLEMRAEVLKRDTEILGWCGDLSKILHEMRESTKSK